jgi:hypothetical protein
MTPPPLLTPRQAILRCALTALTALACAGLLGAAALVPAPPAVLPFIIVVCVCCPMLAAWEASFSVAALRTKSSTARVDDASPGLLDSRALRSLRRQLDQLPETRHPLGL